MMATVARANKLMECGEYELAEAMFLECRNESPENPAAYVGYARVAQMQCNWNGALLRWQRVLERFPGNIAASIGKANTCLELGKYEEAEAYYLEAQTKWPNDPRAFVGYARAAQMQCRWTDAMLRWESALGKWVSELERSPGNMVASIGRANICLELGQFELAETYFLDAQLKWPGNPNSFVGYARVAQMQCLWSEALKRWQVVLERFPKNMPASIGRANASLELEAYGDAETYFNEAQLKWPDNPNAFIGYARVAQMQYLWEEALVRWQRVLDKFPYNVHAPVELGSVLLELGEFDKAEEIFLEAQKKWPNRNRPFYLHHRVLELQRRM